MRVWKVRAWSGIFPQFLFCLQITHFLYYLKIFLFFSYRKDKSTLLLRQNGDIYKQKGQQKQLCLRGRSKVPADLIAVTCRMLSSSSFSSCPAFSPWVLQEELTSVNKRLTKLKVRHSAVMITSCLLILYLPVFAEHLNQWFGEKLWL